MVFGRLFVRGQVFSLVSSAKPDIGNSFQFSQMRNKIMNEIQFLRFQTQFKSSN